MGVSPLKFKLGKICGIILSRAILILESVDHGQFANKTKASC